MNFPLSFWEENLESVNYIHLLSNRSIPFSFLLKNINRIPKITELQLKSRYDAPLSYIEDFFNKYSKLICMFNENLTLEFLEKQNIFPNIVWEDISFNKNIPFEVLEKYENKFEKEIIFSHPDITIEFIKRKILEKDPEIDLLWECLCANENIDLNFLEKFSEKIDFIEILNRNYIPNSFLQKYSDKINILFEQHYRLNVPPQIFLKHWKNKRGKMFVNKKLTFSFFEKIGKYCKNMNYLDYQFFCENKIHSFSFFKNDF